MLKKISWLGFTMLGTTLLYSSGLAFPLALLYAGFGSLILLNATHLPRYGTSIYRQLPTFDFRFSLPNRYDSNGNDLWWGNWKEEIYGAQPSYPPRPRRRSEVVGRRFEASSARPRSSSLPSSSEVVHSHFEPAHSPSSSLPSSSEVVRSRFEPAHSPSSSLPASSKVVSSHFEPANSPTSLFAFPRHNPHSTVVNSRFESAPQNSPSSSLGTSTIVNSRFEPA